MYMRQPSPFHSFLGTALSSLIYLKLGGGNNEEKKAGAVRTRIQEGGPPDTSRRGAKSRIPIQSRWGFDFPRTDTLPHNI